MLGNMVQLGYMVQGMVQGVVQGMHGAGYMVQDMVHAGYIKVNTCILWNRTQV